MRNYIGTFEEATFEYRLVLRVERFSWPVCEEVLTLYIVILSCLFELWKYRMSSFVMTNVILTRAYCFI